MTTLERSASSRAIEHVILGKNCPSITASAAEGTVINDSCVEVRRTGAKGMLDGAASCGNETQVVP